MKEPITYFKSAEARKRILNIYDSKLEELNMTCQSLFVPTSFGHTHLLKTGQADGDTLVILHGSNACAPIALDTFPNLQKKFKVFALDLPAQPNLTTGRRLSMRNDDYGRWLHEVLEALGLDDVILLGFSQGGLAVLKALIYNQDPVKAAYLVSPAFLANGNPLKLLRSMFLPLKRFIRTGEKRKLEQIVSQLFTQPDEFTYRFLTEAFPHFEQDFSSLPTIKSQEGKHIKTALHIFSGGQDIIFPAKRVLVRANRFFQNLQTAQLFPDQKHVFDRLHHEKVEEAILNHVSLL